jgi:hypothetical protein
VSITQRIPAVGAPAPTRARTAAPAPAAAPEGRLTRVLGATGRGRDWLLGLGDGDGGGGGGGGGGRTVRSTGAAVGLFVVVAVFYPVYQLLTRGKLFVNGSMWAEMATNYYAVANSDSLWEQLLAPDAGYIPLPQRLIAFAGTELGLPPAAVPYLYNASAAVLAGLLIGSICLPAFRPVLNSDGLRFVLAIALVLVPDFQTRTFINFTYFAVVPAVALTALAAVQKDRDVPGWAWLLPVFMLSKPGVLAVLPAMVVVALVSRARFRWITLASVIAGLVQLVRLAVSSNTTDSLLQNSDQSALSKLVTSVKYTFGFLGRLVVGPGTTLSTYPWLFLGLGVLLVALAAVLLLRSPASPLVIIGLSLVLFTMLLNGFTFSAAFTRDMALLSVPGFDRRFVVALIGAFFVVAGLIALAVESPRVRRAVGRRAPRSRVRQAGAAVATAAFVAWFVIGGWVPYTAAVNVPYGVPISDASQWQEMSPLLADATEPVVCVPVDPFGWEYGRNCSILVDDKVIPSFGWAELTADRVPAGRGTAVGDAADGAAAMTIDVPVPDEVTDGSLASLAIMVRPPAGGGEVPARAVVRTRTGAESVLFGSAHVPSTGGLLQFVDRPTPLLQDVDSVRLEFDEPVSVGATDPASGPETVVVLWMGQPG